MTLTLHTGARPIEFDELCALPVPPHTKTHYPIAHDFIVNTVREQLKRIGYNITSESHGVTDDAARYFGVLELQSEHDDYTDMIGLRNSHDKRTSAGIGVGSRVFVCDNMAFSADYVLRRKHTRYAEDELPDMIARALSKLSARINEQSRQIHALKLTAISRSKADSIVVEMYRHGILTSSRLAKVIDTWDEPPHNWGDDTLWKLFNCATTVLEGRVMEHPESTRSLHNLLNAYVTQPD